MNVLNNVTDLFGLDIGSTAIRLVELRGTGPTKVLAKYAYMPLDGNIAISDAKVDQQKLARAIDQLINQAHVSSKNVAVGVPSSKVFTTVADIDRLSEGDLAKAIRFQADALIPTPLAESKIDWALIGDSPVDKTKVEILLSSVTNKFVEDRLDLLEGIGLNVIAFEPDNLAMTRSLLSPDAPGTQAVINVGARGTDLVITNGGLPRLTRSIPVGTENIIRTAAQNLSIDDKQAEQFVMRFGLSEDKLEGQVAQAVQGVVESLVGEVEKSIKFYQTRYADTKVEKLIVTGGAATIPKFPLYLADKLTLNVEIGDAWKGVSYSPDRQTELAAISSQFSVAVGLAERQE